MTMLPNFQNELNLIKEQVFDPCGLTITTFQPNTESKEYGACSFLLNEMIIEFRVSKITPVKTGQFVTLWKRNGNGMTEPLHDTDSFDFVIIAVRQEHRFGLFVFPKNVLVTKGIVSHKNKSGKRGFRVYLPWDKASNKQAQQTQEWQVNYFLAIENSNPNTSELIRHFFQTEKQSG